MSRGAHNYDLDGDLSHWPYAFERGYPPNQVQLAICSVEWQEFREGLKGRRTSNKLYCLHQYREAKIKQRGGVLHYLVQVRIDNYLGALRRGGLLDVNNRVIR